jgi:hypothetical protein
MTLTSIIDSWEHLAFRRSWIDGGIVLRTKYQYSIEKPQKKYSTP